MKAATPSVPSSKKQGLIFQSTPPVKAATVPTRSCDFAASDISIHAAREGGDFMLGILLGKHGISIHAAREGGDAAFGQHVVCNRVFQSTPPVKAATGA